MFGQRLNSIQDGDGTLLDHSMIVYGSSISEPNGHLHYNLPVLLLGPGQPTDSRVQSLLSEYALFFGVRVVFGLVVPLAASVMTWRTARIRSLDSATGLLYIVAALVLAGEIAARTLFFLTGVAT